MPSTARERSFSTRRSVIAVLLCGSALTLFACGTTEESLVALTTPTTATTTPADTKAMSTTVDSSVGATTSAPATSASTASASSTPVPATGTSAKPRLTLEPVTVSTKTDPVLTASAQLPTLTGFATADADSAATTAARKIVTDFTDDFVTMFEGPDALDVNRDGPLPTLELTTSLANTLDRFVSLRFEVYADYGGAHPVSYVQSITFDAVTGKQLKLTDLAKVQKGAVSRIANAAVDSIIEQMPDLKDFTTVDLTTPAENDWNAWFPERDGVRIVFSQGEAGPSAAGVIDVFIPWDTVTGVTGATGPQ